MAIPKDVKDVLIKVFQVLKEDPGKLTNLHPSYCGKDGERAHTVENLENVACNRLMIIMMFIELQNLKGVS